jgi:hypothetical protein
MVFAGFDHVGNLESRKRNVIRHSDEIRRGWTLGLDGSLFLISCISAWRMNYTVLYWWQISRIWGRKSTER